MPRIPKIRWAQRQRFLIVTFDVGNASNIDFDYKNHQIAFKATDTETEQEYAVTIALYGSIVSRNCVHTSNGKYVRVTLPKAPQCEWERLTQGPSKDVKHFVTYDWDLDNTLEDDKEPEPPAGPDDDDDEGAQSKSSEPVKPKIPQHVLEAKPEGGSSSPDKEKIRRVREELDKTLDAEEKGLAVGEKIEIGKNELIGLMLVVSIVVSLMTFFITRGYYLH